uniref:RAMA domain-containing protein n=1 Tax=Romanomermis culicivorax TaxID=13658 RepID=A0A915IXF0_ROMCU
MPLMKIETDLFEIDRILNYSSSSITCNAGMQNSSANTNLGQLSQSSAVSSFNYTDTSLTASGQLFSQACCSPKIDRKPLFSLVTQTAKKHPATTYKTSTQMTMTSPPRTLSQSTGHEVSKILDKAFHNAPVSRKDLASSSPQHQSQRYEDKSVIVQKGKRKRGRKLGNKLSLKKEDIAMLEAPSNKSSSICQVDAVVRNLLSKNQIMPGVNILRYRDPDGILHRASLLPYGKVQANIDGGPIFPRLELWVKHISGKENRTLRSTLNNELKRKFSCYN